VTLTHLASRTPGPTQRSARGLRWVGGAVGLLAGCLLVSGCQGGGGEPPAEATSTRPVADERVGVGRPVSIAIPAAGVDARVVPVGLRADRTMEVPGVDQAGWYEPGPRPGEAGPAVIVGHVDSRDGPAVFFRLGEPVLRLITCGGSFDRSTGHYRDNIIVFAEATT
jgi:hypothetical protein